MVEIQLEEYKMRFNLRNIWNVKNMKLLKIKYKLFEICLKVQFAFKQSPIYLPDVSQSSLVVSFLLHPVYRQKEHSCCFVADHFIFFDSIITRTIASLAVELQTPPERVQSLDNQHFIDQEEVELHLVNNCYFGHMLDKHCSSNFEASFQQPFLFGFGSCFCIINQLIQLRYHPCQINFHCLLIRRTACNLQPRSRC